MEGLVVALWATLPMAGVVKCLKGYNRQLGSLGRLMKLGILVRLVKMLSAIVRELSYVSYFPFVSWFSLIMAAPFSLMIVVGEEILRCAQDEQHYGVVMSSTVLRFIHERGIRVNAPCKCPDTSMLFVSWFKVLFYSLNIRCECSAPLISYACIYANSIMRVRMMWMIPTIINIPLNIS